MELVKAIVEFILVTVLTILADRYVSTRAAIAVACVCLALMTWLHWEKIRPVYEAVLGWSKQNRITAVMLCGFLGCIAATGLGYWATAPTKAQHAEKQQTPPLLLSLRGLFLTDFGPNLERARWDDRTLTIGSKTNKFPEVTLTFTPQLWIDVHEGTEFLGFYIPIQDKNPEDASKKTVLLCKYLPDQFPAILKLLQSLEVTIPNTKGNTVRTTDLPVSRRVYIYHEDFISPQDLGELVRQYEARQLLVEFRGADYLSAQMLLRAVTKQP
jgi:hypothetical protein